ncbi:MAG TPA: hypothetical protein ENG00_00720 [Candidatus Aenigmarchaeota archaeon]|nr:hypothetical protein [Candidatus Aenigmarchaeota archaeon]
MTDITLFIGILGMLLLLIAFVLNLFKKIMQDSATYSAFNAIGSGLLIWYAYALGSIPFLVLEITWTLFAVYKLISIFRKRHESG